MSKESKMFAKLFGGDENQVLVKLDQGDDGAPEVRVYFRTFIDGLGVCSTAFGFKDSDSGWSKAEKCFAEMSEAKAREVAKYMEDTMVSKIKSLESDD